MIISILAIMAQIYFSEHNMGTLTAQILAGTSHPNHGGIVPSHYIFLYENSRPAWILTTQNVFAGLRYRKASQGDRRITWMPTPEHMLEDGLLMVALYVQRDEKLRSLAAVRVRGFEQDRIELYSATKPEDRQALYQACRQIRFKPKIVLSIFDGSTLRRQVSVLEHYDVDAEVCISSYVRAYSWWTHKVEVKGSLE